MSKKTPTELRSLLDGRPSGKNYTDAARYLLSVSPACECEDAEPVPNGHGRVEPEELLSMYIVSPRHYKRRYKDPMAIGNFPYRATIFDAVCMGGLSLMREQKATDDEVKHQVAKIAVSLDADNLIGGIFSVLQFKAQIIFESLEKNGDEMRHFCLYDTPIVNDGSEQDVFSHTDLFLGGPKGSSPKELRTARRVQIRNAIKFTFAELSVAEYRKSVLKRWQANPSLSDED